MFYSYNHVPFIESYKQEHNIREDLSNAFLCYNGKDSSVFNNVEEYHVKQITLDNIISLNYFHNISKDMIESLVGDNPIYIIYNPYQCKYGVYFIFTKEEKDAFPEDFKEFLWVQRYIEVEDESGNIQYEYDLDYNKPGKKYWMYDVTLTRAQYNDL